MIFKPELARRIVAGRKTATRRRVRPDEIACPYRPGRTYAVQPGHGRPAIARIEVVRVERCLLGDLTFADAQSEGFRTTAEFKAHWVRLHDGPWVALREPAAPDPDGCEAAEPLGEEQLAARFDARHAGAPVWVIRFRLAERVRLLARSGANAEGDAARGYTSNPRLALANEPEAVDDQALARIVEEAARKPRVTRAEAWEESRARIAAELQRLEAADLGRDVGTTLRALERQLARLDRKLGSGALHPSERYA